MALRICVLASGSSGNCTLVSSADTAILIDAGLSSREIERRLGLAGFQLRQIHAVCLSHEHGDHTAGIGVLHRRHGLPLYANGGTIEALARDPKLHSLGWRVFQTGSPFLVGGLQIEPFSVPHDAFEPVGFIIRHGDVRVGIVTDMGMVTHLIRERLRLCRAIVIESNHDEQLLQDARRPWQLKQRILGRQGHLSNDGAADLLAAIAGPTLQQVFLAHLSEDCNRKDLALKTARQRLDGAGQAHVRVSLSHPDQISEVWDSG
ncbi:MAG: MBL fold metallo-hydrolase [Kiritimatiellaeota bacterium]|nr:MBL fold metallo-hydrolase [Kiritimatiellota bacterium]